VPKCLVFAVTAAAVVACAESPRTGEGAKQSRASSCVQRVERFANALAPVANSGIAMTVPASIEPIVSTKGTFANQYGATVVVRRDGVYFNDYERLATTDDVRDRLAAEAEMLRSMERDAALYIWADRSAKLREVNTILAVAPKQMERRLLLAGPKPEITDYQRELLKNPAVLEFFANVSSDDPSRRAVYVAEQIEKSIGMCTPLIKAFGAVAGMDAASKGPFLAEAAPKALRDCNCGVADIDLIEYALLSIMGAFDRKVTWVPATEAAAFLRD
jgi:hypothetical protein